MGNSESISLSGQEASTRSDQGQSTSVSPSTSMPPPPLPSDDNATTRASSTSPAEGEMGKPVGPPTDLSLNLYSRLSPLQQLIEHQFNLEILTKHRELRLIDQEMARCQTAL